VSRSDHLLLARVRIAIRALNRAIEAGSRGAGLDRAAAGLPSRALGARRTRRALAEIRAEMRMDQATASDLLARLTRRVLVQRAPGRGPPQHPAHDHA